MTNSDIADFIAGERSAVETSLINLSLMLSRIEIPENVSMAMVPVLKALGSANRQMSNICDFLRRQ